MGSTLIFIHYDGVWDDKHNYNNFQVVGVSITEGCRYDELRQLIGAELKINARVNIELKYQLRDSYPPIAINNDSSLQFYKELKAREVDYTKFPLCATIAEQLDGEADIRIEHVGGVSIGTISTMQKRSLRDAILIDTNRPATSIFSFADNVADVIAMEVESLTNKSVVVRPKLAGVERDDNDGSTIHVGEIFSSELKLKRTLHLMALSDNFSFKVVKSCPKEYHVKCLSNVCGWFVRSSVIGQSKMFKVRSLYITHTCLVHERMNEQRQATTQIVSECIKSKFYDPKTTYTPADIIRDMKDDYGLDINYKKAWRSKRKAVDEVQGKPDESYQMIRQYLDMVSSSNPGTFVNMQISADDKFEFGFMSMYASIKGWQHCRPIVVVDGTFLKATYGGTLLIASVQDANSHILPVAFAIVDSENDASYEWFFINLRAAIGTRPGMCIVSDRNESLVKAVSKIYPEAAQCFCMFHLGKNIKKHFKKNTQVVHQTFVAAATAYTINEFDKRMDELKMLDNRVVDYLEGVGVCQWARAHCPHNRFLSMTSNAAESVNSALRSARDLPVTTLLECLRALQQKWNVKNGDEARGTFMKLTRKGNDMLEENYKLSTRMTVHKVQGQVYQVSIGSSIFVVDIEQNTCTCNRFQMDELPCAHALCVLRGQNEDPTRYCSKYYWKETMEATYEECVNPVACDSFPRKEPVSNEVVLPPEGRVRAGRRSKTRKRSAGEFSSKTKCSKCNGWGHNRKTCRNPPIEP